MHDHYIHLEDMINVLTINLTVCDPNSRNGSFGRDIDVRTRDDQCRRKGISVNVRGVDAFCEHQVRIRCLLSQYVEGSQSLIKDDHCLGEVEGSLYV